jgi:hypothetical protein
MPQFSAQKIPNSRPYRIASAVIDTGFDQLIDVSDQFLGKFHRDELQEINPVIEVKWPFPFDIMNKRFGLCSPKTYLSQGGTGSLDHYGWR